MKRILILCTLMLTALLTEQTQTLNGVKTFTSPPKFKNLVNNNTNTKVLTVNATDVLQWKDATGFGLSDAPIDGQNYVRMNGGWSTLGSSVSPNLQNVLDSSGIFETVTNGSPVKGIDMRHDGLTTNYRTRIDAYDGIIIGNRGGGNSNTAMNNNSFSLYGGNGTNAVSINCNSNYRNLVTNIYAPPASGILVAITENNTEPPTASSAGKIGEIRITSSYLYVCTATNTWVRSSVSSW